MTLRFEINREDVEEFGRLVIGIGLWRPAEMIACWAGPLVLLAGLLLLAWSHSLHWLWVAQIPVIYMAIMFQGYVGARRLTIEQWLRGNPVTIDLLSDAIVVRCPHVVTQCPWRVFSKHSESLHLEILSGPGRILLIPKRAFASADQREAFRSIVRQGLAAGRTARSDG